MKVIRRSPFSHKVHEMDLPISERQLKKWQGGAMVQDAFPNLSDEEREFILTGVTPEEWEEAFGERRRA